MSANNRGLLIVFEGVDRAGKTTQALMLVQKLQNMNIAVKYLRFPDRSAPITGPAIDNFLKTHKLDPSVSKTERENLATTMYLLFSANRWERVSEMINLLNSGTTLVVDRYVDSGMAMFESQVSADHPFFKTNEKNLVPIYTLPDTGLPVPDVLFYLCASVDETTSKRDNFGAEVYENIELQKKVKNCFENNLRGDSVIISVDVAKTKEDVHNEIWNFLIRSPIVSASTMSSPFFNTTFSLDFF